MLGLPTVPGRRLELMSVMEREREEEEEDGRCRGVLVDE